ncbi:MAG: SPOR domain-containing protein [Pseudomonadota bacterium]
MRTFFWLLLLANVILFALIQQGWVWRDGPVAQAQPGLHEEKVRLLDDTPVAPVPVSRAPVPAPPAVTHPQPLKPPLSVANSSPAASGANAQVCLEWGDFSGAELKLAADALSGMQLGNKLDKRQVDQVIRYWVYIPPLRNKAAVQQKVAQLKARGIEEYFIVQDADPWRNAISLGVFKTQEAAENFLDVLRAKDVRTARVGARAGRQKATIFILNGVSPAAVTGLNSLKKDFPGSELKNVPCAH